MEAPRLFVVKKDGRREQYNRDKVLSGLRRACEKRPVAESAMEEVVAGIERALFARASCRSHLKDFQGSRDDLRRYVREFPQGRFLPKVLQIVDRLP